MKLNRNLIGAFLMGATLFLASCGGEEEVLPAPTVSIAEGSAITVYAGETVTMTATGLGSAPLTGAKVYKDQVEVSSVDITAGFTTFQFPVRTYTPSATDKGQDIVFTFEVTDNQSLSGEASFTISVMADTPMAFDTVGAILGNRIGPDFSAWNLVTNVREAGSATSDMQNPSIANGTTAQQWIKGWDSETSTVFVKANDYDYANATVESAAAKFAEGTSLSQVRDVAAGDVYIAKLRGKDAYAVVQIVSVSESDPDSNSEEIVFSYKKATAATGE